MTDSVEFLNLDNDPSHQAYLASLNDTERLAHNLSSSLGRITWALVETALENERLQDEVIEQFDLTTSALERAKSAEDEVSLFTELALGNVRSHFREMEHLKKAAQFDIVTGLYNRVGLADAYDGLVAGRRSLDITREDVIMFLDLDNFKDINDSLGHSEGDEILKIVGQLLSSTLRKNDIIGRWGGDEFVVMLPHTTLEQGQVVAEKLNSMLCTHDIHGKPLNLTFSAGVDRIDTRLGFAESYDKANEAMRAAKQAGRNRIFLVDQGSSI